MVNFQDEIKLQSSDDNVVLHHSEDTRGEAEGVYTRHKMYEVNGSPDPTEHFKFRVNQQLPHVLSLAVWLATMN